MKFTKKHLKNLPYNLSVLLLTGGASLILGFLSFSGMYALYPVLPVAFAAFGLSVAYEGEIYLQNIKGALHKLFANHFLQRQIARQFLLESFPDTNKEDCPQFFKDYEERLALLMHFQHKTLDAKSRRSKKQIEKQLSTMEKRFANQLFDEENSNSNHPHIKELKNRLKDNQEKSLRTYDQRKKYYNAAKLFSLISSIFMGFGTTYLLVEAFTTIPFFAAISLTTWPLLIAPMAVIAAIGSGLLTYNAMTDLISNETISKWYHKIRNDLKAGLTPKSVFMAVSASILTAMALALTICTAGTWWTVVKETRPLYPWMGRMPGFIMTVINPIITGLSAVAFNLQNTSETLELVDEAIAPHHDHKSKSIFQSLKESISAFFARENIFQAMNPVRLLIKLTYTPIRILLFLGHLISIAVTADRVPGVPQIASALLGLISEGFEDAHYFIPHAHAHHDKPSTSELLDMRLGEDEGHSHDDDLPTRALKVFFLPIFLLSAVWDCATSKINSQNEHRLTFNEALQRQAGMEKEVSVNLPADLKNQASFLEPRFLTEKKTAPLSSSQSSLTFFKPEQTNSACLPPSQETTYTPS